MTSHSFDSFIRLIAKSAHENFTKHGVVEPVFITVNRGGEWSVFGFAEIMSKPDVEVATMFETMRKIAADREAVRCAFVSEAYTLDSEDVGDAIVKLAVALAIQPRYIRKHREVVTVNAEDRTEGILTANMEIIRPEGRKPYLLALQIVKPVMSQGNAVGLLPEVGQRQ